MKTNLAYLLIILISKNLNACEVGQYDNAGTCTDCPVHEFSTTTDATECTKCPIGSEQATVKSMICTKCPVGKSNTAAGTVCANCLDNETSDGAGGACTKCPAGKTSTAGGACTADYSGTAIVPNCMICIQ